jgi:phosphotransferase system enzyme I (PtsP)
MPLRGALAGPRLLLRRLREVMAEPVSPQARLDKIVVHIASNMVAEVCSVYVLRSDGRLELFATEGLNREAVHLTTMRAGEGLVGLIAESAEPLALADAQSHPAFSYKPETGEEIYHSFLGVPILRGGNTLGVLVVQNRARRTYSEEEIEVLQTTAMLIAEMIASGELQSIVRPGAEIALRRPIALTGAAIAEGGQVLGGVEAEGGEASPAAHRFAPVEGSAGLGAVFNDKKMMFFGDRHHHSHINGLPKKMHGNNGFGFRGNRRL